MKAQVLHGIGDLRYENVPVPRISEGEALIEVKACGVCGSDVPRILQKGTYSYPLIPGHELSGKVADIKAKAVGEKEERRTKPQSGEIKIGDKVVVIPLIPCKRCIYCQVGKYNLCDDYDYLGSRTNGAFAEYVKAPLENLIRMPEGVSFEEAALTEPSSVALHALSHFALRAGDTVAIFGAGPVGLLVAEWASLLGASEVFIVDLDKEKLTLAHKLGFENLVHPANGNVVDYILKRTNAKGVDISVEAAGIPSTFVQSIQVARKGGKVVFVGNVKGNVQLEERVTSSILRKELTMYGTWNSHSSHIPKNEWETNLNFMKMGKLEAGPLISHRIQLKELSAAIEMMQSRRGFFAKVMVVF